MTEFDPTDTVTVTINRAAAEMLAKTTKGVMLATGAETLAERLPDEAAEQVRIQYRSTVLLDGCYAVATAEIARLRGTDTTP